MAHGKSAGKWQQRSEMTTPDKTSTVLLVEDDAELASMVSDYLEMHGFEVSVEGRGDLASERITQENPDAVLLDINLPGRDGFEVCREVRSRYRGAIIMLTARGDEIDEVLAEEGAPPLKVADDDG